MKKSHLGYTNKYTANLFISCWIAYFSTYICRLNFSVVMPELSKGSIMTEEQLASVSSAFFICYGIGQLFSGILGDKVSPKILVFLGTCISALSNILIFAFCKSYTALILLWGINGIVQSLVWSPILRIAGDYFNKQDKEKFATDISTTVTIGTLVSYGIGLVTLLFLPWNYVFLTCGLCTLAASVFWIHNTKKLKPAKNTESVKEPSGTQGISLKQFIKIFTVSGCLILLIPIAIQGTLKDSITQWMPTFFGDYFNLGTDISIILTMVLPVVNVSGAYIARAVNKHVKNEMITSALFFSAALIFLVLMLVFGIKNSVFALVCVAVITTCMHAINVMFITLVPLHFSKYGCTSTMGGLLNSFAYIGCGALNIAAGKVLNTYSSSWNKLFCFWLLLSIIAIAFSAVCSFIWKRFVNKPLTVQK